MSRPLPVLDVPEYVAEFERSVLPGYVQGTADVGLAADDGLARSIIPPATSAVRDFSSLSPSIPHFMADACVGCMACVNACPDTAILGTAQPRNVLQRAIEDFAGTKPDAASVRAQLSTQFVETQKYATVPERKGLEPALFGIFVDPTNCKGCAECVEVCANLGHNALVMVDKERASAAQPSTIDRYRSSFNFLRSLPPTPDAYRNDKALADLMLGEHALGYVGGAGSCSGCGEATALRMLVAATRQIHGPESMGIVRPPAVTPSTAAPIPSIHTPSPGPTHCSRTPPPTRSASVHDGIRRGTRIAGCGPSAAMARCTIGFQALSRLVASGADIKVMVLDTQAYSNTGGQASTASFGGQITKLSAFGRELHGRPERRKELGRILMAHGDVYVAQTTTAHINHFYRSVIDANEFAGPAVVIVYTPCQPEHGIADDAGAAHSRLAVESRAFPLFTYDPRRGDTIAERLSLQGNPRLRDDLAIQPDGSVVDFVAFARTEARFAAHFALDGTVSHEMTATNADRLSNWRTLQEMAGVLAKGETE